MGSDGEGERSCASVRWLNRGTHGRSGSSLHSPGQETLETRLFDLEKLPHEEIDFSSVRVVLGKYAEDVRRGRYSFHHGVIEKEAGVAASSPRFKLAQYTGLPTEHKL